MSAWSPSAIDPVKVTIWLDTRCSDNVLNVSVADEPALFRVFPALRGRVPWVSLGVWPTPVEPLAIGSDRWVKRDDLSGVRYGGNKVRTLEALFGQAQSAGARRIWATGAFGSNHALATVLHAADAGLEPGVMIFPQPPLACARENLVATLAAKPRVRTLLSWATLPFHVAREMRRRGSYVMWPGGATPEGAFGYVSAAFELAEQVRAGLLPLPQHIVVGVGSTCTTAGLLAGFTIAQHLALLPVAPTIFAVRVTPWPVTSTYRMATLASNIVALMAERTGSRAVSVNRKELLGKLRVIGGFLGRGYGHITPSGVAAHESFRHAGGPPLDLCYSAKAAAALLALKLDGPTLFWATKSSRPLPVHPEPFLSVHAPSGLLRWWLNRPTVS